MKYLHTSPLTMNFKVLMNRMGYHEQQSRKTGIISYIRRLSGSAYPRFHLYVDSSEQGIQFKIHLDEKQASYENHTAHSGQYDGDLVNAEMERIKQYL